MEDLNQNTPETSGGSNPPDANAFSEHSMKLDGQQNAFSQPVMPSPTYGSMPLNHNPYQNQAVIPNTNSNPAADPADNANNADNSMPQNNAYNQAGSPAPQNPGQFQGMNMQQPPQGYQPFPPQQSYYPPNPYSQQQNYQQQPYYSQYQNVPPRPQYQPYYPPNGQPVQNIYGAGIGNGPVPTMPMPDEAKKKRLSRGWITGIVFFIGIMIVVIIMLLVSSALKGDNDTALPDDTLSDSQSDSSVDADTDSVVDIPIQEKPSLDSQYYADEATGLLTTTGVAERVSPSVVGIQIYGDSTLYAISAGSGIVLSEDGYIITNAHVLEGAVSVKVILNNGDPYVAEIVGKDSKTDLAVIKINETGLVPADMGDSKQLKLGEQVAAIGNAGGFSGTVTFGYVSGLDREVTAIENGYEMKCIQTDAAVNPGNSGGALVNMYGQVVGIVSSKYVATGYEGIGFAISMNEAVTVLEDIISQGYISGRVRVGIKYSAIGEADADTLGVVPGLLVGEISPECDVANTNLKVNDIITELNGVKVYNAQTIVDALKGKNPGDKITAKVYRKSITDEVTEFEITFELMQDTTLN